MARKADRRLALAALGALAGCSLAPAYRVPETPLVASYKEEAPWQAAEPADQLPRDAWWTIYGDAELDDLERRLIANSPDLAAALARYQQAQAISEQARSGLFPSIVANASVDRFRQSAQKPLTSATAPVHYDAASVGLQADYELDLWGRVRDTVVAGEANAAAAQADLESARLSLQAQLADDYIVLRGYDREGKLLDDTVAAYQRALDLTQTRHQGGIASGLDVARAQTQLDTARSQVSQTLAQRALTEHAIAALIGESAASFGIEPRIAEIHLVAVPPGVPSTLLQRRPDVAAAERRTAAANAQIGVARAAYFPSITLDATVGYQSSDVGHWLTAPNAFWSIGPSLLLDIFDAGKRKAQVAQAQAQLDEAGARYRGVVLGAFQQVEDNLALLKHYRAAADDEKSAVDAAQRSLDFAMARYREGAVNYLDVVTSQTVALQAQSTALDLDTRQLRASVQLVRAIGGGWEGLGSTAALSDTTKRD